MAKESVKARHVKENVWLRNMLKSVRLKAAVIGRH